MTDATERLSAALADRYCIEHELGAGGMATVYLAEDLKHDRKVAIKVLRPELAAVLGAERFVQEIKTTAALSHPHILPLFDSGEADGFLYYVMPYIQGETIRDKLNRETQFGVDDAVRITTEVADALDYAHRNGVIHRDIKPENLLLHDGRAMVMDFGIALAVSAAAGGRMTETGLSLGTPHYMSPEQATAEREITSRSDIYSLASVLYEMLTGQPPHSGGSAQQIIMKIVTEDAVPVTRMRKSVPPNVAAAVAKALEKLPADRFDGARAFAAALTDPSFAPREATGVVGARVAAGRGWMRDPRTVALSAVTILAVSSLVWTVRSRGAASGSPTTYDVALPDSAPMAVTNQQSFTIARSGAFVVYHAQERAGSALWYRSLADETSSRIAGTDQASRPALSPDDSRLAFIRNRDGSKWTLEVMPLTGGPAATLGEGTGSVDLQWLDDGRLQVVEGDGNRTRWFDPGGGPVTPISAGCWMPTFLPAQDGFLCGGGASYWAWTMALQGGPDDDWAFSTGSPDSTRVFGSDFRVVDGSYVAYMSIGGDLLAAPIDLSTHRIGRSVRMVTGVGRSAFYGAGSFAVSRSGTLVYSPGPNRAVGHLVTTDGATFDTLAIGRDAFHLFALSPDKRRLATVVDGLQGAELRVYDLQSGGHVIMERGLTIRQPVWSPRGDRVLFSTPNSVFVANAEGTGAPTLIASTREMFEAFSWTAEDRVVGGLWGSSRAVSLDPTKPSATWDTLATDASFPTASPDGRWLAYQNAAGTEGWVAPLPSSGLRYQVVAGSFWEPRWLSDRDLAFMSVGEEQSMMLARMDVSGGTPVFTRRLWTTLPDYVETAGLSATLTADGRVMYVRGAKAESVRFLRVVPGWVARMKRAVDEANE